MQTERERIHFSPSTEVTFLKITAVGVARPYGESGVRVTTAAVFFVDH
jgi:hypothetical protein